jgi:pimeloyl-ACP methyl ester carboxylesterase
MPVASVNGVKLYYEVTGDGFPLVLSHEFAGTYRSWEPQVKFFSRRYEVITYNHRGFPPSDAPAEASAYSQEILVEDLHRLLRYLGVQQAFIGGCSMGGTVALSFGITHPEMTKGLIIVSAGSGSSDRKNFEISLSGMAQQIETIGWKKLAERYAREPNRIQLLRKDPKSWQEFRDELAEHDDKASALLIREVILKRPTIPALENELRRLPVPTLIMIGDEDERCIEPAWLMKKYIPGAGLIVFPQSGHAINLEEPDLFNRAVLDFMGYVEAGKWAVRS